MPSGPKRRRAAANKKKKEKVDEILDQKHATISEDATDNLNSKNDAISEDHPNVATVVTTIVDLPESDDPKAAGDDSKAVSNEAKLINDQNQYEPEVLPSVDDTNTFFSIGNEKGSFVRTENSPFGGINPEDGESCPKQIEGDSISKQDSVNVSSKNSSEDAVLDDDASSAVLDIVHESISKGNEDSLETNVDAANLTPPLTFTSESEEIPIDEEKLGAILTHDHMASEARQDGASQTDDTFLASEDTESASDLHQNSSAVILSQEDSTVKDLVALEQADLL